MRTLLIPLASLLFIGCSDKFTDDGDGDGDDTGSSDGGGDGGDDGGGDGGDGGEDGGGDGGADSLTDPRDSLQPEECEDPPSVPGAAGYWFGEFEKDDDGEGYRGEEHWILYANSTWEDLGQGDCEIVWLVSADEVSPGACSACDVGLSVRASLDISQSTCPDGLWEDEESYEVTYGVRYEDDGRALWYFAGSGEPLGEGHYSDSAFNYLTEMACKWF